MIRLITRSLAYHWRIHLAVALGVAAATAVLTGALVVGDSMRGSLAHLALDRLGSIDDVLVTDRFFRRDLASDVAAEPDFQQHYDAVLPAILLEGSFKRQGSGAARRAANVTVVGCADFGNLGSGGPDVPIERNQVVLNEPLAHELGAKLGDDVILRVGQVSQIPADSPLGRKTETVRTRQLTVSQIIPADGLGRFGLRPSQQLPLNAFVAAETLAAMLDVPGKFNALFVSGPPSSAAADEALQSQLHPALADYGFVFSKTPRGYWNFTSLRVVLDPAAERAVRQQLAQYDPQPVFTYLANTIAIGERQIPYSTITALEFTDQPPLGPFLTTDGQPAAPLADDEIALNRWAADDLQARLGDEVQITYFEPESTHGEVRESSARFKLAAILPLEGAAADRDLTPELHGITDQTSIGDWDPPFPFDAARVRKKDEQYWDDYRTTPKAFVSPAVGRKLWASRFGSATSLRLVAPPAVTAAELSATLQLNPLDYGFRFLPVRRYAQLAATGTTPFSALFLAFSFFIIAAAVMLVALLFQLGVEQRATELGTLLALGWPPRRVVRLLAGEGLLVAALGALLGLAAGVGYAWLMLAGLKSWWLGAISTPFLELYVTPLSLALGYLIGMAVAAATIWWTARRLRRYALRQLLAGAAAAAPQLARATGRWPLRAAYALLAVAVVAGFAALGLGGEAQAGAFFTAGMSVLAALLLLLYFRLRRGAARATGSAVARDLGQLALRSGARNPARSTLSIGLVAAASFLIIATGAFRLDPANETRGKSGGSGGFALVAESDLPVYQDLSTAAGRRELSIPADDDRWFAETQAFALRVRAGDDASCLNLYQPGQPRVLGLPTSLLARGGFAWAASAAQTPEERANPWLLLERQLPTAADGVRPLPVVLDLNTAMYSLHLWKGVGETYEITDEQGAKVRLQVVGLLKNSIFQGDLLLGERQFLELFPGVSGYRFFLIAAPAAASTGLQDALEQSLEDYGFDAQPAVQRLAGFMVVQNTYLSTFQSLGGLGLLLGTFGLAVVQLRSVFERRGELALMQAVGFRRRRLAEMVLLENAALLVAGLVIGILAALVAVLPHLAAGGASIPWGMLGGTLAAVLAVGLLAGLAAVRAVLRGELLPALRAE